MRELAPSPPPPCRTHEVEYEVDISIILCAHYIQQTNDVIMPRKLLEVHDLAESALRVRGVSESIKALFQGHDSTGALIHSLPHNAVGLGGSGRIWEATWFGMR